MKIIIRVIRGVLIVLILLSLLSDFYEYDLAKRTYLFNQEEYIKSNKTVEEVIEISSNTYRYFYQTFKQKMILDFIIYGLLIMLVGIESINKKKLE
jgi:hypothetical protein